MNATWIKMSERKPTEADLPVWCHAEGSDDHVPAWVAYHRDTMMDSTHWMPATNLPAPPPRELTQEDKDEVAFEEWHTRNRPVSDWCCFQAGIAYERAEIAKIFAGGVNPNNIQEIVWDVRMRVKGAQ